MPSHFATTGVHPGSIGSCPTCSAARQSRRPPRQARGYDAEYDRNRATLIATALAAADAGQPLTCHRCHMPCLRGQQLTADHVTAIRHGGRNELGNLAAAHAACNYGWRRSK